MNPTYNRRLQFLECTLYLFSLCELVATVNGKFVVRPLRPFERKAIEKLASTLALFCMKHIVIFKPTAQTMRFTSQGAIQWNMNVVRSEESYV